MLRKANNVFSVLLNDGTVASTALPTVGTVVTPANLPSGAVVLVNAGMQRISNTEYALLADGDKFFVVEGRGTSKSFLKSPVLTKGKVKFTISRHKPAVQQRSVIGYNGTTGSLPTANFTDFWIKLRKRDNDAANRSQPMSLFAGPVRTDAAGTQRELAILLMKSGIRNFTNQEPANGYVKFEAISDGTAAAIGATTLAATNQSKLLTYSAAHSLVIGDLVFIAGATYEVATVPSTTTVMLTVAFQGTTVTALATGTTYASTHGKLTAVTNWGIAITGVASPFDVNQFRDYYANRFTATFSDTTTLVSHMVGAFNGNGTWQQVAMDEYMGYGFEGEMQQTSTPAISRDQFVKIPGIGTNTVLSSRYSCLGIAWEESISGLVSMDGGKGSVFVYLNLDSTSPLGLLDTVTANNGETFVQALGLTAANFDMV